MDFFCLSFTSGSNIQLQAKIGKIASQKEKKMTAQNFKIAPLSPLYKFSPPPFAPFQIFAPKLTKIAPRGRFAPLWETLLLIVKIIFLFKFDLRAGFPKVGRIAPRWAILVRWGAKGGRFKNFGH